ncbi:DUF6529 family protein [Streptomyces cocklensis]|jgi:hypothetical protein|uniref:Uncharacterized protein n=1 Tax=Actinacidiphila cocklensis TaxID=887465 RepID=A0A9W4DJZ0_9ACTN|nr:DUF6529 family protein [Actinacidiphila cocklensis]MDD1063690.1 DUF6529 family protein [Actinacidiphila cocklensis]CAG6391098.1 conserved membrane hypothetical protein [Actinacidiphila cocklensis]
MKGRPGSDADRPARNPAVRPALVVLVALLPFAAGVGVYEWSSHVTPDYNAGLFGVHGLDTYGLKARLGTALLALALVQLGLALWMYGRVPGTGPAPRPVRTTHRIIGLSAFLLSLPIAFHCITAYGFESSDTRVTIHSIGGCVLYAMFVAKVVIVRSRHLPGWVLPVAGGALICGIALMWYTAALWVLNGDTVPGL